MLHNYDNQPHEPPQHYELCPKLPTYSKRLAHENQLLDSKVECNFPDILEGDEPSLTNYELHHMLSFQHLTKSPFQALEQTPVNINHVTYYS